VKSGAAGIEGSRGEGSNLLVVEPTSHPGFDDEGARRPILAIGHARPATPSTLSPASNKSIYWTVNTVY